jgi:DNA-binding CsgD family transcriptional regulator
MICVNSDFAETTRRPIFFIPKPTEHAGKWIRVILVFSFLLFLQKTFAQNVYTITEKKVEAVAEYAIVPDQGYTFHQVLTDSTILFTVKDSLHTAKVPMYWIRINIKNPYHYARNMDVRMQPIMDNTLYYFDDELGKWTSHRAGILTKSEYDRRMHGVMPCTIQGKATRTIYIRANVSSLRKFDRVIKPEVFFSKKEYIIEREQNLKIVWIVALTILFIFFLNNLYIYFSFRDKTVLYYLMVQLGGMIYITSYRDFFSVLFHCPVLTYWLSPSGIVDYYNTNYLLMHIGIIFIMYGFVQFTRSFFNTRKNLPATDQILKKGLVLYLIVTVIITCVNATIFYLEHYTMLYENVFALLLTLLVLYTCIAGFRLKLPAAGSFLLANMLPLIFILGTTIFHMVAGFDNNDNAFLPDMSIIAQSLGFSIALVARTRLIQTDLKNKEIEARQLEFDLHELRLTQRLIEVENHRINAEIDHEKTMNEILQERLDTNQRELASTTLYIVQKNKMLSGLKDQISELQEIYPENKHEGLKNIESILKNDLYLEADWDKFKLHFEQVHPRFFEALYAKHPTLTKNEIRIHAYFHMKLSTKEIASLLNIDPASVRRAKTRLYKKMSLSEEG